MSDSVTEVSSESWFGRLGKSIGGVLVGFLLFVVSFPVLFLNEGRAVHRAQDLSEGLEKSVDVGSDSIVSANDTQLVVFHGTATTDETLTDPVFAVSGQVLRLIRQVEMYQWEEKKESKKQKKLGGREETVTTYSYQKDWSTSVVNSDDFQEQKGHENPGTMEYSGNTQEAEMVTVGAFAVPDRLKSSIRTSETRPVTAEDREKLPEELRTQWQAADGKFYKGESPAAPQVGDLRVTFQVVKPLVVSLLGVQQGGTVEPYFTSSKRELFELREGSLDKTQFFAKLVAENNTMTWILRGVGFLLMAFGIAMIFKPLSVLVSVLPIFGDLADLGIGLFAFSAALVLSLITIAVGWLAYRPILGVGLIVAAVGVLVGATMLARSFKKQKPALEV